jgi:hypothetical protein
VVGAVLIVILDSGVLELVLIGAGASATVAATKAAFAMRVPLPDAARPGAAGALPESEIGRWQGGAVPARRRARARGIRAVELDPGSDLEHLARNAVADGADALAMAGGDGSQAIVAAIAAEHGLPYACIPAGTRNHFALDLGVDREDVVGALDAFVGGGEKRVDLAEVNGRVFVNNVSLGLYAEAVQREGYRDAKLRTILDTVPDVLGPERRRARPAVDRPGCQRALVGSRDPRLEQPVPAGHGGRLGHAAAHRRRPARHHGRRSADRTRAEPPPSPAAVARVVGAGLRGPGGQGDRRGRRRGGAGARAADELRNPAGVLRVRIARAHPGASPSTALPDDLPGTLRALLAIAAGRRAS